MKVKIPKSVAELMIKAGVLERVPPPPPKLQTEVSVERAPAKRPWNSCCICGTPLSMLKMHEYDYIAIDGTQKAVCPTCIRKIRAA